MALKYHLVRRRDMRKNAAPSATLLYGQVRSERRISFDRLCKDVSKQSTASKGDVLLVINALIDTMQDHLAEGDIVHLGELGTFRITAGSTGAATEEEFNTSLFKKGRIVFTPGSELKLTTREVNFEKIVPLKSAGSEEPEGGL